MIKINTLNPLVGLSRYQSWKSRWAEEDNVDEFSYISSMCNPEDVLLMSKLFFPDFVVVGGGVFLGVKYSKDIFDSWIGQFDGDLQETEKMINHTHLYDVFDGCSEEVDNRVFEQLAEVLALSWRLVLSEKFPEKKIKVEILNSDQDYGPIITFYQMSKSNG